MASTRAATSRRVLRSFSVRPCHSAQASRSLLRCAGDASGGRWVVACAGVGVLPAAGAFVASTSAASPVAASHDSKGRRWASARSAGSACSARSGSSAGSLGSKRAFGAAAAGRASAWMWPRQTSSIARPRGCSSRLAASITPSTTSSSQSQRSDRCGTSTAATSAMLDWLGEGLLGRGAALGRAGAGGASVASGSCSSACCAPSRQPRQTARSSTPAASCGNALRMRCW